MIQNRVEKIQNHVHIRRILLSVYDKSGLEPFVSGIAKMLPEVTILSTGGTFEACRKILGSEHGGMLMQVSDYTGMPEMHGGLVKTLDFRIYLGLLSEPFNDFHREDLEGAGAVPIDMVVANLYPFEETVRTGGTDTENARSNIDIGGPCMIRAAAKNYLRVASVSDPADYGAVLAEMKTLGGALSLKTRFSLAVKAFAHTAAYDVAVKNYLESMDPASIEGLYELADDGSDRG